MGSKTSPLAGHALTPREREVLALVQSGLTNRQVARHLGISENAVRYHLKELQSKLGTCSDRSRLARMGGLFGGLFVLKAKAGPVALAALVTGASAAGFWAVRTAHESRADAPTVQHCASALVPTPSAGVAPLAQPVPATVCFSTRAELLAYYESLP